jgi:hypothetical protein
MSALVASLEADVMLLPADRTSPLLPLPDALSMLLPVLPAAVRCSCPAEARSAAAASWRAMTALMHAAGGPAAAVEAVEVVDVVEGDMVARASASASSMLLRALSSRTARAAKRAAANADRVAGALPSGLPAAAVVQ